MQSQKSEGTAPEVALRSALHAMGLRYRLHRPVVPGTRRKVDIVFGPSRVAVFLDGCFWHGCRVHGAHTPTVNTWYWPEKIKGNRDRDEDTNARLRAAGWEVVRVWEHEDPVAAARKIGRLVLTRRPSPARTLRSKNRALGR